MDTKIDQLLENVKASGTLQLNINQPSVQCRKLYGKLLQEKDLYSTFFSKVISIELPMEDYTHEREEYILRSLLNFPNLKCCSLIGGRHTKKEIRCRGGIVSWPAEILLPKCIEILDLSFNKLCCIPVCLKHLSNLKILMLDYNNIEELSFDFWDESCCNITELYLRSNMIAKIDKSFSFLTKVQVVRLSSNKLVEIPDVFHLNLSLVLLDLSNNSIEVLPDTLFRSSTLKRLLVSHNKLVQLSFNCISSTLEVFDVRYNHITDTNEKIINDPRILLDGNTPLNVPVPPEIDDFDVATSTLMSDCIEIDIDSSKGTKYILPSGIKIIVPNNFSCNLKKIYCNVICKEPTIFKMQPTDQLLSVIVELTPNGIILPKPMHLSLPFSYSSCDKQIREIIMRVTSVSFTGELSSEDLPSEAIIEKKEDNLICGEVTAFVKHFSLFGVVSRLKEDSIILNQENHRTLFSTVDANTKLHFPENSVLAPTCITIKMLVVNEEDVKKIVQADHCPTSNVLHVSVNPSDTVFNFPITVHLALPDSLVGRSFDRTKLRLMKCHNESDDWFDITEDVVLIFSNVDVSFQVNSFSNFVIIWKEFKGVVRKIYRRLITYKVQFIAMQRKVLPHIILTQCIRTELVDKRMQQLLEEGYCNNDSSSEVHELMEGDKFKIKVIGDIKLKEEFKNHLEEFGLIRQFHSQYPPERTGYKFPIEPINQTISTVTGYISFYKVFETLVNSPESDCNSSSTDNQVNSGACLQKEYSYLDDILITLESTDLKLQLPDDLEYQLRFSDYASGMFDESTLRVIASKIGMEWEEIGHYLGIRTHDMQRIKLDYPNQSKQQIFFMLQKWSRMHMYDDNSITEFIDALKQAGRTDLAEYVLKIYHRGVENFKSDIKRAKGLPQPESFQ